MTSVYGATYGAFYNDGGLMAESLVIAGQIELLQGGVPSAIPACAGAIFLLTPGYDLGAPQRSDSAVAALVLDGERPVSRRASNRVISLPVKITAPDRQTLAAAREVLLATIDHDPWQLTWTRAGSALPMVLDCFRAEPVNMGYDLTVEGQLVYQMVISFQALPYGRSDTVTKVDFQVPIAGKTAPPAPVTIDDFSTGLPTGSWTQSLLGPGAFSAFWRTGTNSIGLQASYSRTGIGPFNLTGLPALTVWAGFGSSSFFQDWGQQVAGRGKVQVKITLGDGTHTISFHVIRTIRMTNNSWNPFWQKLRIAIPQGTTLTYSAVTAYSITISARPDATLPFTDVYLDTVEAVPVTRPAPVSPVGGAMYDLAGIVGSARSLMSLQLQQPAGTTAVTTKRFTTPGPFTWLAPAGVTQVTKVACVGGGGRGAKSTGGTNCGAGGGGGEYAQEVNVAVTAGNVYAGKVATGGGSGTGTGGQSQFIGNSVTVTANGGANVADGSTAGGTGGTGSVNTTHFNGGAGGNGATSATLDGGGGGGSGGPTGAGGAGATSAAGGAGGAAGTGGQPSGAGGRGALAVVGGPGSLGRNPGGGGGGDNLGSGYVAHGGLGEVDLTYTQTAAFKTLVVHRPGNDAPDTFTPYVPLGSGSDIPDGTTEYPVPIQATGLNARFGSTYTIVLVNLSWHSTSVARLVTVTVNHYEQAGGTVYTQSVSRTVTPNTLASPLCVLGELTLPDHAIPDDNVSAYFTVTVTSADTADRFQDVLILDTQGSTVMIESPTAYVSYWIDEPASDREIGNILGSQFDRNDAVSVLAYATVSGPPLHVDPLGSAQLLVYAADTAALAPSAQMTYWPRWMLDRVA